MNVELTPDQRAFVRRAIEHGRFKLEEEAVQEALALWEERERRRVEMLAALDEAEASLARGEGRPIDEKSIKDLGTKRSSAFTVESLSRLPRPADATPRQPTGPIGHLTDIAYYVLLESGDVETAERLISSIP